MRGLKVCLWIAGILCLLSVFGMFLPVKFIESVTKVFGGGAFPDSPEILYVIRVVSAMSVGVGVFFVILALHPMKYGVMVPFSGLAAVFLGVVCAITGLVVSMPFCGFWVILYPVRYWAFSSLCFGDRRKWLAASLETTERVQLEL